MADETAIRISAAFTILLAVATIVGNLTAVAVLAYSNLLRTPLRFLLANLAVVDLALGVVAMPYAAHHALATSSYIGTVRSSSDPGNLCQVFGFLRVVFLSCSSFTVISLSYERYIAIAYPLKHAYLFTTTKAAVCVVSGWTLAVLFACVPFLEGSQYTQSPNQFICWPQGDIFVVGFVAGVFGTTWLLSAYLYMRIVRAVRKHRSIIHSLVLRIAHGFTGQRAIERLHVSTTIALVLGMYLITWAPFCFIQLYAMLHKDTSSTSDAGSILATTFLYANSACNPWIYCGLNATFKGTLKRGLGLCPARLRHCLRYIEQLLSRGHVPESRTIHGGYERPANIRFIVVRPTTTLSP